MQARTTADKKVADLENKSEAEALARENEHTNRILAVRRETLQNQIETARVAGDALSKQDELIKTELEDAEEKHNLKRKQIRDNYVKAALAPGLKDEERLARQFNEEVLAEDTRYVSEKERIHARGLKTIDDLRNYYDRKYASDAQKQLNVDFKRRTEGDQATLHALEAQYDALDEVERKTDYGKNLKRQIDGLTVSITENTIQLYENAKAAALLRQEGDSAVFVAQLQEQIDRLSERLRTARKGIADYDAGQKDVWAGLAKGWSNYIGTLETGLDIGRRAVQQFGDLVQSSFSNLFSGILTGELKSFKDFFNQFAQSLTKIWTDMLASMLMNYIKTQMQAAAASEGGGILGWIFRGIGSIFGAAAGGGAASYPAPATSFTGHRGGLVREMHEGGLQRDEVLSKLLINEFVMQRKAVQSIGLANMEYMNQTGRLPQASKPQPTVVEIYNVLDPTEVVARGVAENQNIIINPVVANYGINGPLRRTINADR